MEFETKKGLLEYLGKDTNDRKLVDRMISRGDVELVDGMYVLVDKDAIIAALKEEIEVLKKSPKESSPQSWDLEKIKKELEEAQINSEYWEKQTRRYGKLINSVISICYKKLKALLGSKFAQSEDSFREWILEEVKLMEEAS